VKHSILGCIVFISLLIPFLYFPNTASGEESYSFGVVPQFEQRKIFAVWQPIINELAKRTGLSFRLVTTLKIADFDREFMKGNYDFAYVNPYLAGITSADRKVVPLVADKIPLRGIVVVRNTSPIRHVSDLNGKVVAFPAPNAIGATLLVLADLDQVHHIAVKPLFAKTHSSVYLHVVNDLVDAGGGVEKTFQEQPPEVRTSLRILYTTRFFPSHPVTAQTRIPEEDREKVKQALIALAATPAGKELLLKVPIKQLAPVEAVDYIKMLGWGLEKYRHSAPGED
jgi:phosphonate transport system substrate-binding protein